MRLHLLCDAVRAFPGSVLRGLDLLPSLAAEEMLTKPRTVCGCQPAAATSSQVEGSGLGLAIAKWIADMQDARISVDSTEHTGSIFRIVFPVFRKDSAQPGSPLALVARYDPVGRFGAS